MSRRRFIHMLAFVTVAVSPGAALAQDGATGSPPERIDLTLPKPTLPMDEEECRRRNEVGVIAGEIVVCRTLPREDHRVTSREEAQDRYAERTKGGSTPDVAGPGIFRGKATLGSLCVPGVLNCPKPPAVFVDVRALPQAPPGSDADRIARGLAPLGRDEQGPAGGAQRPLSAAERAELGLPDTPAASPSGSAGQAAPQ